MNKVTKSIQFVTKKSIYDQTVKLLASNYIQGENAQYTKNATTTHSCILPIFMPQSI